MACCEPKKEKEKDAVSNLNSIKVLKYFTQNQCKVFKEEEKKKMIKIIKS